MKIRLVGATLLHADRRTEKHVTKLIIAFRNFANVPKISNTLPLLSRLDMILMKWV